jgi:hypothetical protein
LPLLMLGGSVYGEGGKPVQAGGEVSMDQIDVVTPVYRPDFGKFQLPQGTYTYEVSWQGIPAARATLDVFRDGAVYRVETKARTNSAIDLLYKLRFEAEAAFSSESFVPRYSYSAKHENSKSGDTTIKFLPDGYVSAVRTEKGKDPKYLKFQPRNFMLDPFSAAFLARSLKWRMGETKYFDTFNGKTRYLIALTALDKVSMTVNGQVKPVWVISPKVTKLTEKKDDKKLRKAFIYVTDDKARDILQIKSEVFVGTVTTKLVSYSAMPEATAVVKAQRPQKVIF